MMDTTTKPTIVVVPPTTQPAVPVQQVTPEALASILKDKGGRSSFLTFDAVYDMTEMDARNQPKKMKKTGNPFLASGLEKHATTQVTVNWASSQEKSEKRGGDFSGAGTWFTAVIVGGKVTPLAVHKADIETEPADGPLAKRRAIVVNGGLVYKPNAKLFYLRYEIVRAPGDQPRQERTMRSTSHYQLPNGDKVDKSMVEPFLKSRGNREDETDIQVACLSNVTMLRIDGQVFDII